MLAQNEYKKSFMNWLDQLYAFRDKFQSLWSDPHILVAELRSNHILLSEVVGASVALLFLLFILFKKPRQKNNVGKAAQKAVVSKSNAKTSPESQEDDVVSRTVKAVQNEDRKRQIQRQSVEQEKVDVDLDDLSKDEEVALADAMQAAGKQALAEAVGEPHQAAFFEEESVVKDAAKKMFSKSLADGAFKKPTAPLDFLMLYYMAPRSQPFAVKNLFNIFEDFNLYFNEDNVFEYSDQQGLQFYIASALKPGTFHVNREGETPGLSFVLDLQRASEGRVAFNKMLIFVDALSKRLRGDILDDRRQRMTAATMNEYIARIKAFNQTIVA